MTYWQHLIKVGRRRRRKKEEDRKVLEKLLLTRAIEIIEIEKCDLINYLKP